MVVAKQIHASYVSAEPRPATPTEVRIMATTALALINSESAP